MCAACGRQNDSIRLELERELPMKFRRHCTTQKTKFAFLFPPLFRAPALFALSAWNRAEMTATALKSLLAHSTRAAKHSTPSRAASIQTSATRNASSPAPAEGESLTVASSAFMKNTTASALATPGLRFLDGNPNNVDPTRETKKMKSVPLLSL